MRGQLADIKASDIEMGEGDLDLSEEDKKELQDFYKSLDVKGDLNYTGGEPDKVVPKVGGGDNR